MHPLETYLTALNDTLRTGAGQPESAFYGALETLLNEVGGTLKPVVRCVLQLRDQGEGRPDGGLFTADQVADDGANLAPALVPARGALEVKPLDADVDAIAQGPQVQGYHRRYRQVLVTNYWDFLLVGSDTAGRPARLERYRLAADEARFRAALTHPRAAAERQGDRFVDFLKRVMLHAAPLANPADVAFFLASYAREAKARIESSDLPALTSVRRALEEALGLAFQGEKGEHFFRSSLVQTLFYGVFSAWVLWSKRPANARFNWHETGWFLHVPMIRTLFEQVATPAQLGRLGLVEVLDWAADALNRVDRKAFFARFQEEHAVQYFYEPFLRAFDPDLRKSLGVWYTPPEIVQYMVARVDTVLREELGIADGLADRRVYVLDPCCGTGAYLVEVLKRIAATLREKGGDALTAHEVKRAAVERVFGFEILPAPFVVAHLQLGLYLQSLEAPLADERERAGIYLTNALTGWEPPTAPKAGLPLFPELEEERQAAHRIKREVPILVILGNPPYNAFAGVSPQEERGLVEPYKEGLVSQWGIRKVIV